MSCRPHHRSFTLYHVVALGLAIAFTVGLVVPERSAQAQQTDSSLAPAQSTLTVTQKASVVVEPGDTLGGIAQRFGTKVESLVKTNEISNPDLIFAGERLLVDHY